MGSNILIEKFRDINMNGTEDVIVYGGSGGAGEMRGFVSVMDFNAKGSKEYGSFTTDLTVCMWNPPGKNADTQSEIFVKPGMPPKFTANIESTDCETQTTTTSPHTRVVFKNGFLSPIKLP